MPGEASVKPTALEVLQGLYHCGAPAEDWPALLGALPPRALFVPGQFEPGLVALADLGTGMAVDLRGCLK